MDAINRNCTQNMTPCSIGSATEDGPECQRTAHNVVSMLLTLAYEVQDEDGRVSYEDLERISKVIAADEMAHFYHAIYSRCHEESRKRGDRLPRRVQLLGRVITRPLEPLLFALPPVLDKSILPFLFDAVRDLLGPNEWEQQDNFCRSVYNEYIDRAGDDFEWDQFYDDPRMVDIMVKVLLDMTKKFSHFPRGYRWFMSHMTRDGNKFSTENFMSLMVAFLRPVTPQSEGMPHRDLVVNRGRESDLEAIDDFFRNLKRRNFS